jgi:hypothetical protein
MFEVDMVKSITKMRDSNDDDIRRSASDALNTLQKFDRTP